MSNNKFIRLIRDVLEMDMPSYDIPAYLNCLRDGLFEDLSGKRVSRELKEETLDLLPYNVVMEIKGGL